MVTNVHRGNLSALVTQLTCGHPVVLILHLGAVKNGQKEMLPVQVGEEI